MAIWISHLCTLSFCKHPIRCMRRSSRAKNVFRHWCYVGHNKGRVWKKLESRVVHILLVTKPLLPLQDWKASPSADENSSAVSHLIRLHKLQLLLVTLQGLFSFHNSLLTPETWLQWLTTATILRNKVFFVMIVAPKESNIILVQENVSIFAKKHEHLLSKSQVPTYLHHKSRRPL